MHVCQGELRRLHMASPVPKLYLAGHRTQPETRLLMTWRQLALSLGDALGSNTAVLPHGLQLSINGLSVWRPWPLLHTEVLPHWSQTLWCLGVCLPSLLTLLACACKHSIPEE